MIRPAAAHLLARATGDSCRGVEGFPLRASLRGKSKLGSPLGTSPQHVCVTQGTCGLKVSFFPGSLNHASRIAMESMSGQQQQDVGFKVPALPAQLECIRHNVACGLQAAGQQLTRAAHGIRPKQVRWPQESEPQMRAPCRRRRLLLPNGKFAAIIPGDTIAEQVITTGVSQFLSLYNTAIIARLVLTWFPNPPQAIAGPLSTLCDPYLNLFRGIIPPLGGTIDLSPILAFIALDLFSNTAAALPCELNEDGTVKQAKKTGLQLTPSQFLGQWQRRQQAKRRESRKSQSASAQA